MRNQQQTSPLRQIAADYLGGLLSGLTVIDFASTPRNVAGYAGYASGVGTIGLLGYGIYRAARKRGNTPLRSALYASAVLGFAVLDAAHEMHEHRREQAEEAMRSSPLWF